MPPTHAEKNEVVNEEQMQVTLDEALRLAQGHHQSENYILAERTYRDILRAVPDHFPTTQMLGALLFQAGNFDEAEHYMEIAVRTQPDNKACWNNYGGVLTRTLRYEEALEAYNKALEIDPDYLDALNNKSYTLWLLERYGEAEETCRKALALVPGNITALNNLGIILAKRVKFEESLEIWEKASEINPLEPMIWSNWGNALREMGRLDDSAAKCRKAIELAPDNSEALNNLANALRDQAHFEEAIALYRKATNEKPDYFEAHGNLSIALLDNNQVDEALVAARYAVAFNKGFAQGYSCLSKAACRAGKYDQAQRAAQHAVYLDPDNVEAYLDLSDVLLRLDQFEDSEAALQEALKREPSSTRFYLKLSEIREYTNNFKEAHEAVDNALKLSPEMPAAWLRKALIYYVAGDLDSALNMMAEVLKRAPEWIVAMQYKAEMLVSVNKNEEASVTLRKVLDQNKELPGAYSTLTSLKKFTSEDDPDFQNMKALEPKVGEMALEQAAVYHYAMSDAYEHMGNYKKSFEHLKLANDTKRQFVPYLNWKDIDFHDVMRGKYTPEFIQRFEGLGSDSDVPIFIVGMPRSGTTLTEQILSSHPDVFGAGELPELGKVHKISTNEGINDAKILGDEYVRRIRTRDKSGAAKHITDKMPANYMYIGFMACILPKAKIIHCRRNPVDTCLSCYKQNFARGQYWSYNLEEMAGAYERYASLMAYWREVLPGRFMEIDYEETVSNFEDSARKLIDFAGLEWDEACLKPHKQKRSVLTASKAQVTKPVYQTSVDKWKRYEKELQPLVAKLDGYGLL